MTVTPATPATPATPTTPVTPATPLAAPRPRTWLSALPAKYYSTILITLILVVGQFTGGIVGGFERMAVALGVSLVAEVVLSRLLRGVWPSLLSAYISGNSVAILTKPAPGLLWPYWMGGLISIMSKYVLTYRNRHLWNPTNFSFSALLLLAPGSMSLLSHQWGNDQATWAVMAVGLLVVWRAKLLHITGTYVLAFAALSWLRAAIAGGSFVTEVAPLTGPMYMLLIFFMLTDPRTVVSTRRGRVIVTLLVALLEFVFRLLPTLGIGLGPIETAPPIFALAIVGPLAMWLDLRRKPPPAPRPAAG